jgi:undecaprenyl-diphosphatase
MNEEKAVRGTSGMHANFEVRLLFDLNHFVASSPATAITFMRMADNSILRGFPVFFSLVVLWFSTECRKRRARILAGLLVTCFAVVVSIWLQHHLPTHIRPYADPTLHLQSTVKESPIDPIPSRTRKVIYSFPSDTATMYFALASIIFLESRMAGTIAFLWSVITVGVARVGMGWHYPSDVAGGLILGILSVYLFTRMRPVTDFFERKLAQCDRRMYIVHALLFIFLADAFSLFAGIRAIILGFRAAVSGT